MGVVRRMHPLGRWEGRDRMTITHDHLPTHTHPLMASTTASPGHCLKVTANSRNQGEPLPSLAMPFNL